MIPNLQIINLVGLIVWIFYISCFYYKSMASDILVHFHSISTICACASYSEHNHGGEKRTNVSAATNCSRRFNQSKIQIWDLRCVDHLLNKEGTALSKSFFNNELFFQNPQVLNKHLVNLTKYFIKAQLIKCLSKSRYFHSEKKKYLAEQNYDTIPTNTPHISDLSPVSIRL